MQGRHSAGARGHAEDAPSGLRATRDIEARIAALAGRMLYGRDARLTAAIAARELGWVDRHALKRDLRRLNLPPFRTLHAQLTVCRWMMAHEHRRVGLARVALEEGREPASAHRTVQRVSGSSWTSLTTRSPSQVFPHLAWLLDLLRAPVAPPERSSSPHELAG